LDRRSLFGSLFDPNGFGLEIGPSYNPTLRKSEGYNIEIVDFQDAAALRLLYPGHDIEEVDYVTGGRPLTEVIARHGAYDFIIASHVVSHIPDLIGFLADCQELLKSDGVLVMAVPDKRRCFTLYRATSTTGDVLQARLEGRHRHPPGRHFDQHAFTAARDGHVVWPLDYPVPPEPVASLAAAQIKFNQAAASTTYIDTHSWSFLPSSFRLIMRDLWDLGETRLREHKFVETSGPEFFISLGQFGPGCPLNRSFLLRRTLAEMAAVQEVRDAVVSAQKGANEVSEPNAAPQNAAPLVDSDGSLLIRSLAGHYQPLRWHPDMPQSRADAEAEVPVGWQPAFICDDLLPVRLLLLDGPSGEQRVWFVDKSGMLLGTHVDELTPEHRQALGFALQNLSHDRTISGLLATARLDRISRKIRLQLDSLVPNATYDRGLELGQAMAASPVAKMTELVRIDAASPRQIPAQLSAGWSIGEVNGRPAIVATGRRSVIRFDAVPQAGSYYVGFAYDRLRASGRVTVRVNGRLLGISPLRKVWLHEWPHIGYWIAPQLARSGSIEITLEHEIAAPGDPPALRSVKLLAGERRTSGDADTLSADKLMLKFQSLGDNCQFGFVQRHFGAEPMGLLRFAGIPNLTGAIEAGLEGLGTKGTVRHSLATDNEYMIDETLYGIFYHTFRYADQIAAEQVIAENEIKLHFLRRKFIEDMEDAETIWLRRCSYSNDISEIFALQMAMRAYGPNKLLWVVPAGPDREAGDVEWIAPGLLRGYLGRDASFDPSNFNPAHWEMLCRAAYAAFHSA
jgi:SAM-dependent methyltransferase